MLQQFFVPGPLPNLTQILESAKERKISWRTRRTRPAYSDLKREWDAIIVAHIREAKLLPVRYPVFVKYYWWERDKRRDHDNVAVAKKFVQDALVQAGILPNDNWKWVLGFSDEFGVKKNKPGVLVILEEREP